MLLCVLHMYPLFLLVDIQHNQPTIGFTVPVKLAAGHDFLFQLRVLRSLSILTACFVSHSRAYPYPAVRYTTVRYTINITVGLCAPGVMQEAVNGGNIYTCRKRAIRRLSGNVIFVHIRSPP